MPTSLDEMMAAVNGHRLRFVPYNEAPSGVCGGGSCFFYDRPSAYNLSGSCSRPYAEAPCIGCRKDGQGGYWEEVTP